jgi:hypothetical protein
MSRKVRHTLRADGQAALCGQYGPFADVDSDRLPPCATCISRVLGNPALFRAAQANRFRKVVHRV